MARLTSRQWTVLIVGLSAVAAFALRVAISYRAVFAGELVTFIETDAWYHMRLADALVRDFPSRIWFDPYLKFPGGDAVHVGPFFDWVIAAIALLLGAGSPSPRLLDQVGAFVPPVFGALTVVPVYVIGREVFSRRAGLWAAAIVGLLPGQILFRSLLGFTDHHCAEVLFGAMSVMFLILALRDELAVSKRRTFVALAGLSLGCYLLTWSGGALLLAILCGWATVQMVIERVQGRSGGHVVRVVVPCLLVAGVMVLPWVTTTAQMTLQVVAIGGGLLAVLFLYGLAHVTLQSNRGRLIYTAGLVAGAVAAVIAAHLATDDIRIPLLAALRRLSPARAGVIVNEARPLLAVAWNQSASPWNQFTTSLFIAVVGLGAALSDLRGSLSPRRFLVVIWTAGLALAMFGQIRFSYYVAVPVALWAGYGCEELLAWTRSAVANATGRQWSGSLALAATVGVLTLLVGPNVGAYRSMMTGRPPGPGSIWVDAMQWLRTNTPEPFGDPGVYYSSFGQSRRVTAAVPPTATYGVLAWWDYGYWIIRVGRRVPIANPMQTGAVEAAQFLLSEDEAEAAALADSLGARYAIVNWDLQTRLSQSGVVLSDFLLGMTRARGTDLSRYIRIAYRMVGGERQPVVLYEPAYYRTMMSRLHRAGGTVRAGEITAWAVTLQERNKDGASYWELASEIPFADYEQARAFVEAAGSPNVRLVGKDPNVSCLPLPPVDTFRRVYRSLQHQEYQGRLGPPALQIYERTR